MRPRCNAIALAACLAGSLTAASARTLAQTAADAGLYQGYAPQVGGVRDQAASAAEFEAKYGPGSSAATGAVLDQSGGGSLVPRVDSAFDGAGAPEFGGLGAQQGPAAEFAARAAGEDMTSNAADAAAAAGGAVLDQSGPSGDASPADTSSASVTAQFEGPRNGPQTGGVRDQATSAAEFESRFGPDAGAVMDQSGVGDAHPDALPQDRNGPTMGTTQDQAGPAAEFEARFGADSSGEASAEVDGAVTDQSGRGPAPMLTASPPQPSDAPGAATATNTANSPSTSGASDSPETVSARDWPPAATKQVAAPPRDATAGKPATVQLAVGDSVPWSVMKRPEGGICATLEGAGSCAALQMAYTQA